jgi:hypothetical protein
MISALSIKNFMAIEDLEIDLSKAPLQIFAGQNEAGKSSVRDAILWLWTGVARGLKTHNEQSSLIREGTKFTEVSALLADGRGFTRRKTAKTAATVMGDIPDIGLSPALLFDPYTFLSWPDADRRELLFKIIPGLSPTEQNVFVRLCRWPAVEVIQMDDENTQPLETSPLGIIKSIARMASTHGFPGAEKECVAKRREAKRVRDEYKGATEPEKTLTIDGQTFDIPTLNVQAIEATLKDLQEEKDYLLRRKGAGEARVKRLERVQNQLQTLIIPPEPDPEEIAKLETEISAVKGEMKENANQLAGLKVAEQFFPAICPVITLMETACLQAGIRVGNTPPEAGVTEALTANQKGLIQRLAELEATWIGAKNLAEAYRIAVDKKIALEWDFANQQAEPEAATDYDAEIATRQRRIDRGAAFDRAVHDYNLALGRYQDTITRLAAAEQEVIIYDALQKALAPDGIPSQMIAEALDGINELLEDAASYFFPGRYLHLTGELGIVLQNSPYITLSKSAKYRVGVAFQFALAKLTGARILLIDEADILDDDRQGDLIKFLLAKVADFDQIMVFMTCTEPPDFVWEGNEMQVWWLENGKMILAKVREAA